MTTSPSRQLARLLVFALSPAVFAQSVPPSQAQLPAAPGSDESPVELSPFVVSENSDVGWIATETLAGSRLRTNFKDVPNQIETLTKDFMEDLGVTTIDQALIYTANVENTNDYMPATPGNTVASPGGGGRVRGIGAATLSRNFFQIHNPTDNYNLDRATVASGPHAILFGLGSPAGILDASPARAAMRNKYGFSLQYDSEDSKRGTFDANVVVVPSKLAVRFMGMSKREYTFKQPNLDRDERLYAALTFTPFKNTTIILQGERDHRNWNKAGRVTPSESVTPWLYANRIPGSGYTTPRPLYDNRSMAGIANNVIFAQDNNQAIVIQGGSVPIMNWQNSVVVRNPNTLPGVDPTFDSSMNKTIQDPAIFPFDVNIVGESRTTLMGGYTKTVAIEQRIARNLFVELAYNREDAYDHRLNAGGAAGSSDFRILADANQFLPGTSTPNPNAGKLYFQGQAANDLDFYERDDWRATVSYELDLARTLGSRGRWGKWLGRHRWSGLYTWSRSEYIGQQNFERKILDDTASFPGLTLRPKTNQNWATHATRKPQYRHYFDDPRDPTRAAGSMTGYWALTDATGREIPLYLYETPLRAADGKRLAAQQVAQGSLNETAAQIFAWQGFFLPDREKRERLVLTYGYRKDTAKSATLDNASQLQDFSGLYPAFWDASFADFGPKQIGINRNIGVVARPFRWLSLLYNKSSTFDLNIGRYDPFGNDIPGAGGDGRDYGIRLDLFNDRLTVRLNRYENTIGPQRASNQINQLRDIFYNIETRVRELNPNVQTINVTDGNLRGFRVAGRPNYFIMSDAASKGEEAEINLRPVPNWNIRVNGSRSKAIESSIGGPWFQWAALRKPVWEAVVATNGEFDGSGRPVTWRTAPYNANQPTGQTLEQYYNSALVGRALAFMAAADGRATDTARGARANLITQYTFAREPFKGFNVGGAVRWRAEPTIGYGVTTNSDGAVLLDIARPYKGPQEWYTDAFIGYRGRMRAFGGFTYRLQLNVRNVLDDDDLVPVTALTTGEIARVATVEPRVIVVTFAVNF